MSERHPAPNASDAPTKHLAPPTLDAALDAAETVGSLLEMAGRLDELLGHLPDDPATRQIVARLQATRRQADREAQRVIAYLRAAQDDAAPTEAAPRSPLVDLSSAVRRLRPRRQQGTPAAHFAATPGAR